MKRYILFIVEGNNDKKEIQAIMRASGGREFSEKYVDAYYVHKGDITSEKDSSEKTIVNKLNKIVLSWRNGGEQPYLKISPADVLKIIHVVDTDGVFIPENAIIETDDPKPVYMEKTIQYCDRNIIVGRNRKKARIIRRLLELKAVDNIPYELFFASCNMDHLLFDERNPEKNDKGRNAFRFASVCKERQYLSSSVFGEGIRAEGTLSDSWEAIQQGFHSLERHTNINIFLDGVFTE